MKLLPVFSLLMGCLCIVAPAFADPIPGIFSTGVDNSNAVLAPGTADSHYGGFAVNTDPVWSTVNAVPAGTSWISHFSGINPQLNLPNYAVTPTGAFTPPSTTTFSLNFNIPAGFDPATAQLSFKFSVDNNLEIKLNGNAIFTNPGGLNVPSVLSNFQTLSSLITVNAASILAGANSLTFTVRNNELIEGLLVQIISNDVQRVQNIPDPFPEPTSIALWAMLGGVGTFASRWCRNSRKKST